MTFDAALDPTPEAGPWRLRQGRIVGIEPGGQVAIEQAGDRLRLLKPGVGAMASADASVVEVEHLPDGALHLRSGPDDLDVLLEVAPSTEAVEANPGASATLIRSYPAWNAEEASRRLDEEGRRLAGSGYRITSQSWAAPERSILAGIAGVLLLFAGLFLWLASFAPWLFVVIVGVVLLLIYGVALKPGVLTVTYELRAGGSAPDPVGRSDRRSVRDRLNELDALRSERLVSDHEYEARRQAILQDV